MSLTSISPAWVHSLNEDEKDYEPTAQLLPLDPADVRIAQHNNNPSAKHKQRLEPGRIHDLEREWVTPIPSGPVLETGSRWKAFVQASAYPHFSTEGTELVTEEWLLQNGADYTQPWLAGAGDDAENGDGAKYTGFKTKRKVWWKRLQRTILRNPMVPLIIRAIVWVFSLTALAIACSIKHGTSRTEGLTNIPSTYMAISVDAVAAVYLIYITYDEYTGKPLGLRNAKAKMRLIFLDLFFIVFDSANLSLSFETVTQGDACKKLSYPICHRQKALSSVLLIALLAWLLTFSISVMRFVPHTQ